MKMQYIEYHDIDIDIVHHIILITAITLLTGDLKKGSHSDILDSPSIALESALHEGTQLLIVQVYNYGCLGE